MNRDEPKKHGMDASRRRLAKAALAAPVLMSIPGRQVFAAGNCTLSGDLSGNVSAHSTSCTMVYGRSPGYWKTHTGLLDPAAVTFQSIFGSSKFGSLTFLQVIELAEGACAGGASPPYDAYCGLPEVERQLARHAVAAYLNAHESENGGIVAPGYYFSTTQVVDLYMAVESGATYYLNGIGLTLTPQEAVDLFATTFI